VATDPFVAPGLDDLPRQEPNLAPGVHLPPATSWRADRPGDLPAGQPTGTLFGRPGPNVGYALTLAARASDRWALGSGESTDDALAVVAELAMKRAASFGRAPVMQDVDVASALLGYQDDVAPEVVAARSDAVREAAHSYERRRAIVDAVPDAVLRMPPQVPGLLEEFRRELLVSIGR
jgi:hypothetical protein